MLVLSRDVEESIIINGNITVKIVDMRGYRVRLGITAPKDVIVDREEIHRRNEGRQAARTWDSCVVGQRQIRR